MNRITTSLLAATLSATFVAAETVPVNAQPNYVPQSQVAVPDVQTVQYQEWRKNRYNRSFSRNRTFSRNGDMYWNGHRGYREYRHGYRRHGDYWFPLAAFATGALITGAIINNENNRVYEGNAHVQWCYDHYRSYRASDNTFQPNYGPRRECRSPY
ncbi:BA14K family protein [Mesorhizobium sp.]|uniref:BA14K family protein n=1 Tax=Mesorhizobium sp. TaxID=1871066 RepID=UPI000FE4ED13|nr:BA14K family protein [Mesorhizobium sp.]RWC34389.1 MAG: BA14K family protein [Mesorhizobium sp.]TIW98910.1 MAG: BA14K family protein [Mesorhizobium sp.]TIX28706.1 MAG: BA14K family protein [Mesorhizobium sp.]